MRFSKSFGNVSPALMATAALIVITGVAGAFFDSDDSIFPDSPKYNGSGGWVDGAGNDFSAGVWFDCVDTDNDFSFGCDTDHPDGVNLADKTAKVNQKKNDNSAYAYMNVLEMGGIIEETEFELDCDKVQIISSSNDNTDKMQSRCMLSKCSIPGDLTVDQIASAQTCIDNAISSDDIGKAVTTLKLDNNNLLRGNITSKGTRD